MGEEPLYLRGFACQAAVSAMMHVSLTSLSLYRGTCTRRNGSHKKEGVFAGVDFSMIRKERACVSAGLLANRALCVLAHKIQRHPLTARCVSGSFKAQRPIR